MPYTDSSNITVFPTTKRGDNQRSARLITEQNLVNIVNRLLDVESFVITKQYQSELEFNICGYYFKVDNMTPIINSLYGSDSSDEDKSVYANIKLYATGDYVELYGSDENDSYNGVNFTKEAIPNAKSLKILEYKKNVGWYVPSISMVKFYMNSIITPIDCGEY